MSSSTEVVNGLAAAETTSENPVAAADEVVAVAGSGEDVEDDGASYDAAVALLKTLPPILPPRPVPMPTLRPRPPVVNEDHFANRAARPIPLTTKMTIFSLEEQNERQDVLLAEQRQRTALVVALMSQYVNFAPSVQAAELAFREAIEREEDRQIMLLVEDYLGSHQHALIHTLERLQLQGELLYQEAMTVPPLIYQEEEREVAVILHWHKVYRPYHYCKITGRKFDMVKRLDQNSPTRRNLITLMIPAPPTDALNYSRAEGRRTWDKQRDTQAERNRHAMTLLDWVNQEALDRMGLESDWVRGVLNAEGSELEQRRKIEHPSPRIIRPAAVVEARRQSEDQSVDPQTVDAATSGVHEEEREDSSAISPATATIDPEVAATRIQCCGRQYLSRTAVQRRRVESVSVCESRVASEKHEAADEDTEDVASVRAKSISSVDNSPVFSKVRASSSSHHHQDNIATSSSRGGSVVGSVASQDVRGGLQHAISRGEKNMTPLELLLAVQPDGQFPGIESLINALPTSGVNASSAEEVAEAQHDGSGKGDDKRTTSSLPTAPPAEEVDEEIQMYASMEALPPAPPTTEVPLVGIEILARSFKSMDAGFGGGGERTGASLPLTCTPMAGPWRPVLHVAGMMVGLLADEDSLLPASTCTKPQVDAHVATTALLAEAGSVPSASAFRRFADQVALQRCARERERKRLYEVKPFSLQLVSNVIFNTHSHTYFGQFLLEGCRWEVYSSDPDVERSELEGEELHYVVRHEQADRERIIVDQVGGIMDIWALHYIMRARADARGVVAATTNNETPIVATNHEEAQRNDGDGDEDEL